MAYPIELHGIYPMFEEAPACVFVWMPVLYIFIPHKAPRSTLGACDANWGCYVQNNEDDNKLFLIFSYLSFLKYISDISLNFLSVFSFFLSIMCYLEQ